MGGVRKALIVDASESDFGTCRRCFLAAGVELVGAFAERMGFQISIRVCKRTKKVRVDECIGRCAFGLVRDARCDTKRYQRLKA